MVSHDISLFCLTSSISLHWPLRKTILCLFAILWNSAFRWIFLSFSPLPFASLLFSGIHKASSDNHFAFFHFFFLGTILITISCTILWTSINSSLDSLSDITPWMYLSLILYNCQGFDLSHTWMVKWFSLLCLSLNFTIWSLWSEPQSAPSLGFADCIELLHLRLQRI